MYGTKKATTSNKTSPAKIFPNNLKENDSTLTASDIISKKPKINFIGLLIFRNLPIYLFIPKTFKEKNCIEKTENKASANVVVKSLFGDLSTDKLPVGVLIKKEPKKPGTNAIKFAVTINKKNVAMSGNIFLDNSLSPVTISTSFNSSYTKTIITFISILL